MTYAVRGFAEIVRRLLNAGGDVITPRWSMCSSDRAPIGTCAIRPVTASLTCSLTMWSAECSRRLQLVIVLEMVLTGADNSPDVVGPRGARTVCVVSNLGSTWNDRTVCAEQKIVPGAARHPVAATRRGGANGDGAGAGRIRSAPGDRHHQSRRSHALSLTDKISIGRRLSAPKGNSAQPLSHKPTSCGLHGQRSPTLWNNHSAH